MKPLGNMQGLRPGGGRRMVATAFTLVGAGVVVATAFALVETRDLGNGTNQIIESMTTRANLLEHVDDLIERRRILVDDHIFARDFREMAKLEGEIGEMDREMSAAIHAYEPWADLPGERSTWNDTREALAALDEPMAQALALSRVNRDVEARQVMDGVAQKFDVINRGLDELTAINERSGSISLEHLASIRSRLQFVLLAIGGFGLATTIVVGVWAAKQVARREEELSYTASALAARNRELDAFAARVAHDIRSPLASMKLAIATIAAKAQTEDRGLQVLRRSSQRMESLVEDLMTLALSEGAAHGRCDPAEVARQVQDDFRTRVDAEHGNLRLEVAHAQVACSEGLLHQALSNLLENAVKYRRPDVPPDVELAGAPVDGGYDLRVSDNGMGMSPEEADRAFEPFYRSPRASTQPGTGLGLSIVNRIVEVSGGSVSVQTNPGQGTTFVMHLPLAAARREPAGA